MDVSIDGHDLAGICAAPPPFLSAYLELGSVHDMSARLHAAAASTEEIEAATRPTSVAVAAAVEAIERRLDVEPDLLDDSAALAVVTAHDGRTWTFALADPVRFDLVRWGSVPSLGGIVESAQVLPTHAVVMRAGDGSSAAEARFDLVSFGSRGGERSNNGASQLGLDLAGLTHALRFVEPALVLVDDIGDEARAAVRSTLTEARIESIDPSLDGDRLADHVVTVAASLRAELTALELGRFRAARDAGRAVEGNDVLAALVDGTAVEVLVHDDPADHRLVGGDRLVDRVVATALVAGVSVSMIPDVAATSGPTGGIGALLGEIGAPDRIAIAGGVR